MHIGIGDHIRLEAAYILQHQQVQHQFLRLCVDDFTGAIALQQIAQHHDDQKRYVDARDTLEKIGSKRFIPALDERKIYDKPGQQKKQDNCFLTEPK